MSIKCLTTGLEVRYPCSPVCALFGDCVSAFEAQKKAKIQTNADRIRNMSNEELADYLCEEPWRCQRGIPCERCARFVDGSCISVEEWLQQPAKEE